MNRPGIEQRDGFFFLVGKFNEATSLTAIEACTTYPIKLNLEEFEGVTSIASKRLGDLIRNKGEQNFEFYDCPTHFIWTINVIPRLIGRSRPERVKSFSMPFVCSDCSHKGDILIASKEVKFVGSQILMPAKTCEKCQGVFKPEVDLHEFFLYVIEAVEAKAS